MKQIAQNTWMHGFQIGKRVDSQSVRFQCLFSLCEKAADVNEFNSHEITGTINQETNMCHLDESSEKTQESYFPHVNLAEVIENR